MKNKKRGRPKKLGALLLSKRRAAKKYDGLGVVVSTEPKKKRGRPKKFVVVETEPIPVVQTEAEIEAEKIRKSLHHVTANPEVQHWLDTGVPELNGVFGSPTRGIAYGMLYNIWGPPSQGKSLVIEDICGMAQAQGAKCAWMPLEGPFDPTFAQKRGIDTTKLVLFNQRVIQTGKAADPEDQGKKKGKKKKKLGEPRLMNIEEICDEAELWMKNNARENPGGTMFLAIDTVAAMLTDVENEAGITEQNMNTMQAHPKFLGKLLRRWSGYAAAWNVMIFMINQFRQKPGVMFGNPDYQPGGNAFQHYAASIVYMHRMGGGEIKENNQRVGYCAVLRNDKNKVGHGSQERRRAGMLYRFGYKTKYCNINLLKKKIAKDITG